MQLTIAFYDHDTTHYHTTIELPHRKTLPNAKLESIISDILTSGKKFIDNILPRHMVASLGVRFSSSQFTKTIELLELNNDPAKFKSMMTSIINLYSNDRWRVMRDTTVDQVTLLDAQSQKILALYKVKLSDLEKILLNVKSLNVSPVTVMRIVYNGTLFRWEVPAHITKKYIRMVQFMVIDI